MKTCKRCKEVKPLSDFGKDRGQNDGLAIWCKECSAAYQREWRQKNLEHARAIDRKNKSDERKRKGQDKVNAEYRAWYAKNPEHKRQYVAERRKDNKKKIWAQNKLNKAVMCGKIERPSCCSNCGKECKPDGHHHDYDLPYDVIWLCRRCHTELTYVEKGGGHISE